MQKISWSAWEYEEKERSRDWFWALGIIIVAGSITAIILNDYFFAILLVLGGISLGFFATRKPELITYDLEETGFKIKNQLYLYKDIKSFFVRDDHNPALFIKTNRIFMPIIVTYLHDVSRDEVKEIFLANNVPEEEMKEHFSEKVLERLDL
ncbi:MAG: hypothetical protein NT068_01865 [Candidatus Nomurabacteria bacterium]|nr:hypothetical protein [Candidatus Nomurabacteria bacterium]